MVKSSRALLGLTGLLRHFAFWRPPKRDFSPFNWSRFSKVVLHTASEKLVNANELYAPQALAISCVGGQTLCMTKSKQNISEFRLIKGSLMGDLSVLRRKHLLQFQYKLCWLAPDACPDWHGANSNQRSVGRFTV
jgi:ribosomal protein L5